MDAWEPHHLLRSSAATVVPWQEGYLRRQPAQATGTPADLRNRAVRRAYTSAVFSETRYALNGDLRVAYRTTREGARDIALVPNWFKTV